MHDAFLKSVFADRRMVEILIRGHAPEWASDIDFATLREESTGLVSKKTLQRRHPDMIWSDDTVNGDRVLFLLEFQRTVERLMALRTTTYSALALEGIAAGPDFRPGDPLPEFVYLVLYHGDGPWTVPAHLTDLFNRSDPGRYRLVPWAESTGDDPSRDDLTALVLGLARNLSPEEMAEQLSRLWRTIERHGDPGLAGWIVQSVGTMLEHMEGPAPAGLPWVGADGERRCQSHMRLEVATGTGDRPYEREDQGVRRDGCPQGQRDDRGASGGSAGADAGEAAVARSAGDQAVAGPPGPGA